MGERGQLIVTVFEVIGVYSTTGLPPETFCQINAGDKPGVRTKAIKVSERATNPRNGVEVRISDLDDRSHKLRVAVYKQAIPEPTFLGHVKLELHQIPPNVAQEHTVKIKKSKGKGFAKGSLHFSVEYRHASSSHHDDKKRKENAIGDKFRGFSLLSGGPKKHKRVFAQPPDPNRAEVPGPLLLPLAAMEQRGYHTTEGLFRISAAASEVEAVKELYESGKEIVWTSYDPHVLAGIIVHYLLNLPEPLTTFELYDSLISAYETGEDLYVKKAFMKKLLATLPPGAKACMETLMVYLAKVASFTTVNKMTSKNLGIVFGPALLRRQTETPQQIIRDSPIVIEIVTLMVDSVQVFFKGQELVLSPDATAPPPSIGVKPATDSAGTSTASPDVAMDDTSPRVPPITPSPRRNTGGAAHQALASAAVAVVNARKDAATADTVSERQPASLMVVGSAPVGVGLASSGPLAAPAWARGQDRKPAAPGVPAPKNNFMQLGKTGIRGNSPQKASYGHPSPLGMAHSNSGEIESTSPPAAPHIPSTSVASGEEKDADDALRQVENLLRSREAEAKPESATQGLMQSTSGLAALSVSQTAGSRLSISRRGSRNRLEWSRLNQTRNRLTQRINSFGHLEAAAMELAMEANNNPGELQPTNYDTMQVDASASAAQPTSAALVSSLLPSPKPAAELSTSLLMPVAELQEVVAEDVSFSRKNTVQPPAPDHWGAPPSPPPIVPPSSSSTLTPVQPAELSPRSKALAAAAAATAPDPPLPKAHSGKNLDLQTKAEPPPKPLSGKNLELKESGNRVNNNPLSFSGKDNGGTGTAGSPTKAPALERKDVPRSNQIIPGSGSASPPPPRDEPPMPFPMRAPGTKGGSGLSRNSRGGVPSAAQPTAPLPDVYAFLAEGKTGEQSHTITTSGRRPGGSPLHEQSGSRRSDPPLPLHTDGSSEPVSVNVANLPAPPPVPPELSSTLTRARALSITREENDGRRMSNPPLPSGARLPIPLEGATRSRTNSSKGTGLPGNLPPPPARVGTPPHYRTNSGENSGGEQQSIAMLKGPTVPGRAGSPLPSVLPSGSTRVGQVGAPTKTTMKGNPSRDSADAPPRAARPIAPEASTLPPLVKPMMGPPPPPPAAASSPRIGGSSEEDDLLAKMRSIIAISVQAIIELTSTVTARIADGTFYDVISCSIMLKNLKRLLDEPAASEELQSMLLDHARTPPPRPNLRDASTAKRFNQFCTIAGVTLSELVTNLSQMSKELDADILVMERSEVLANAANLALLVRDVRAVLDNFVSYTLRHYVPGAPKNQASNTAQRAHIRRELEQSGERISVSINEELARLATVEEAVSFSKMVKNVRQLLADRNPQQSLFLERVEKPLRRERSSSSLEVTRLDTTRDMAHYSVTAVSAEINKIIVDARANDDLQDITNLLGLVKNIELVPNKVSNLALQSIVQYIREYTEAVAQEHPSTGPSPRPGDTHLLELPDEEQEQLALLQRTAASVLSSIQSDLTQLRMELEAHGADPDYENRILQIAKIASLIKKLMEGTPLPQEWKQIIDGTPFPQMRQDLPSLVRLSVSLFDQARGWLFEQRQELNRADLEGAIDMAQGLSQVAKVAEWYRRQYSA